MTTNQYPTTVGWSCDYLAHALVCLGSRSYEKTYLQSLQTAFLFAHFALSLSLSRSWPRFVDV